MRLICLVSFPLLTSQEWIRCGAGIEWPGRLPEGDIDSME